MGGTMMILRPLYVMTLSLILAGCLDDQKPVQQSGLGESYQETRPFDEERGFNRVDPNSPALEAAGLPPLDQATADVAYQITADVINTCNKSARSSATYKKLELITEIGGKKGLRDLRAKRAQWDTTVVAISAKYGMDPNIIHAIISTESAYEPKAGSPVGAKGMMQLMPGTGQEYGLYTLDDFENPQKNINGGTHHFQKMLKRFNNNLSLAIAAYNAGGGNVSRCGNNIPPFKETMAYVSRVTSYAGLYSRKK